MLKFFIFFLILFTYSPAMASDPILTLGVFPRRSPERTYEAFTPLAEQLSLKIGRRVTLDISNTFEEFWHKLSTNAFDIIHCNQYHYLKAKRDHNFELIATNVEFGKTTIAGAITVRKDSGFNSITDLKGKTIIFGGDPNAMQGYIIITYLLRQAGLQSGDYEEIFAITPSNAVLATYFQLADAAGAADITSQLKVTKDYSDISQLKILASSQQLPQLPWAVSKALPSELRSEISDTLTSMTHTPEGQKALQAAYIDDIIPAEDRDFDILRKIAKEIKGQQF